MCDTAGATHADMVRHHSAVSVTLDMADKNQQGNTKKAKVKKMARFRQEVRERPAYSDAVAAILSRAIQHGGGADADHGEILQSCQAEITEAYLEEEKCYKRQIGKERWDALQAVDQAEAELAMSPDRADEYVSVVDTETEKLERRLCDTTSARLNTRNRELKGRDFFSAAKPERRSNRISGLARFKPDENEGTFYLGDIAVEATSMAQYARLFYKDLYRHRTLDSDIQDVLVSLLTPIDTASQVEIGADFTTKEIKHAIRLTADGKACGPDGIPAECYKQHSGQWAIILRRLFNDARRRGTLPEQMRDGTICILFKKGDPRLMSNYRGITLLCRSYVILATAVAYRLRKPSVLICGVTQRGFVPFRQISDNIEEAMSMLAYTEESKQEGVLIGCDLRKAFDLVGAEYNLRCIAAATSTDVEFAHSYASWVSLLHHMQFRKAMVNGELSEAFDLEGGLPQGSPASCLLFDISEEPKAILATMTPAQLSTLKAQFPDCAELQALEPLEGLRLPDGSVISEIRFADDYNALLKRSDLKAFFGILNFCGKGSGAELNDAKTFIMYIGINRTDPPWAEGLERGMQWVTDGNGLTVLGVDVGYGHAIYTRMWEKKFAQAANNLQSWGHIRLSTNTRVTVFRTYAMSIWAYIANVVPPTAAMVSRMEGLKRRFISTGRVLPGSDRLTASQLHPAACKVSADEMARPHCEGGFNLPTIEEWIDQMQLQWAMRLLDPTEQTERWATCPIHWAYQALGEWTVPKRAASSCVGLGNFMLNSGQASSVLTRSKHIPKTWRIRFAAFAKAASETSRANATVTTVTAEPLWHNKRLQTARGVCVNGREPTNRNAWARWAATVQTVGDLYNMERRRLWTHGELIEQGLSLHTTVAEHVLIIDRVRSAGWLGLLGAGQPALAVGDWVSSSETDVYHLQEWGWEHHRRQNVDRVKWNGQTRQAVAIRLQEVILPGEEEPTTLSHAPRVQMDQWSPAKVELVRILPLTAAIGTVERAHVRMQRPRPGDPVRGRAVWPGASGVVAAADLHTVQWPRWAPRRHGASALNAALQAAHKPDKDSLAVRRAEQIGGPQPDLKKTFMALSQMTMRPSTRDEAWAFIQGSVLWGEDVLAWDASSGVCEQCRHVGRYCMEDAMHFAECPHWDRVWTAIESLREKIGCVAPISRRWFILYGPTVVDVRHDQFILMMTIWATAVAVMTVARRRQRNPETTDKPVRQVVNELHAQLREECRCDLSAATKWEMPSDCGGARRTVHQSESEASWQRRWRGLAQLHRSAVVWYTEPAFDAAAAAQSIEDGWEDADEWERW